MLTAGEPKNDLGKVFVDFLCPGPALDLVALKLGCRLKMEVPLTGENCPSDDPLSRSQRGQGPVSKFQGGNVIDQVEILNTEAFGNPN